MYAEALTAGHALTRLHQDHRLIRVDTVLDPQTFLVKRFDGSERVSHPFAYQVELLSIQPRLELKQLVGQPLRLILGDELGGHGERRQRDHVDAERARVRRGRFAPLARLTSVGTTGSIAL